MDLNIDLLETCVDAAKAGGRELLRWRDRFDVHEKGPADLVTEADFASQHVIQQLLGARFPDHAFLGEEAPALERRSEYQWIVDPLDGTTNFVHGLANYAVSVALRQGAEVLVGAVYDPIADECFAASRGGGATLNGRPIHVSSVRDLSQALVAVSFSARPGPDSPDVACLLAVMPRCQAFRRMGSAALNLAYIAAGRLDAYWASSTKIWDIAAGTLLVREAGGIITAINGSPLDLDDARFLAAGQPPLHATILALLQRARTP